MKKFLVLFAVLALLPAAAANASTLSLGSSYVSVDVVKGGVATTEGGGTISPATLDGATLPWVYCVDINTTINVPGTYAGTVETTDGTVRGSTITNAGEVAWLLDHFAATATTAQQQGSLQAAIWHVIYGSYVYMDASNSWYGTYNSYLTALGSNTASTSDVLWLSPAWADRGVYQGLVTSSVPEPASMFLLGSGLVGLAGFIRRRVRK